MLICVARAFNLAVHILRLKSFSHLQLLVGREARGVLGSHSNSSNCGAARLLALLRYTVPPSSPVQVLPGAFSEAALFGSSYDDDGDQDVKGALWHLLQPLEPLAGAAATAHAFSNAANQATVSSDSASRHWLVLDGSMQGAVADRLAPLLHGQALSVGCGQSVSVSAHSNLIWETTSLAALSPAVLAHVGVCAVQQPVVGAHKLLGSLQAEVLAACPEVDQVRPSAASSF